MKRALRRPLPLAGALCLLMLGACEARTPAPAPKPTKVKAPEQSQPQGHTESPAQPARTTAAPEASAAEPGAVEADGHPGLLDPEQATGQAPDTYGVKFSTTKGDFIMDVHRAWAPLGADRFYQLVRIGYFDDVAFFRVVAGFMAQVGIHGDPRVNDAWRSQRILDDPVKESNKRGYVSFATSGANSRVNQIFINFGDNSRLDPMGFAPFGKVRDMSVLDALYAGYGEAAPIGRGPIQALMQRRGNAYLKASFPQLDYVTRAVILD